MEAYYANKMATKKESELLEYFLNHDKYVAEAVLAAVEELQNRGRAFTAAELATLETERQVVKQAAAAIAADEAASDLPETPPLYSTAAIFAFSIFFNPIFGAALLAANLRQLGNRKGSWVVVGFSLAYMFIEVIVIYLLRGSLQPGNGANIPNSISVPFNVIGAFILNYYFWPKYIGAQRAYESKPIWRALLISILIVLPLLVMMMLFTPAK